MTVVSCSPRMAQPARAACWEEASATRPQAAESRQQQARTASPPLHPGSGSTYLQNRSPWSVLVLREVFLMGRDEEKVEVRLSYLPAVLQSEPQEETGTRGIHNSIELCRRCSKDAEAHLQLSAGRARLITHLHAINSLTLLAAGTPPSWGGPGLAWGWHWGSRTVLSPRMDGHCTLTGVFSYCINAGAPEAKRFTEFAMSGMTSFLKNGAACSAKATGSFSEHPSISYFNAFKTSQCFSSKIRRDAFTNPKQMFVFFPSQNSAWQEISQCSPSRPIS